MILVTENTITFMGNDKDGLIVNMSLYKECMKVLETIAKENGKEFPFSYKFIEQFEEAIK